MSEEEKEALKTIKEELQDEKQAFKYYKGVLGLYSNGKVEILLKLINKQEKEIKAYHKGILNLIESRKKWKNRYYKLRKKIKKQEGV